MLLPEPDSPRIARIWPLLTEKLTSLTALSWPPRVLNSTVRSRTSSSGFPGASSPPGGRATAEGLVMSIYPLVSSDGGQVPLSSRTAHDFPVWPQPAVRDLI